MSTLFLRFTKKENTPILLLMGLTWMKAGSTAAFRSMHSAWVARHNKQSIGAPDVPYYWNCIAGVFQEKRSCMQDNCLTSCPKLLRECFGPYKILACIAPLTYWLEVFLWLSNGSPSRVSPVSHPWTHFAAAPIELECVDRAASYRMCWIWID